MKNRLYTSVLILTLLASAAYYMQFGNQTLDSYSTQSVDVYVSSLEAYTEDTNTVRFVTNDINLIEDSIITFNITIKEALAGEKILLENSNPSVVEFETTTQAAIDAKTVTTATDMKVQIKGYGRAVITASLVNSPNIKQSFPIYVEDYDFLNYDSVYNASISTAASMTFLDPMNAKDSASFLRTHHTFHANTVHQATDLAWYGWEAKHENDAPVKLLPSKTGDTVQVNFSKGGKYVIYLKETRSPDKAIIDSLDFYVNLDAELEGDPETGYLKKFRDRRDGKLYNLTFLEREISGKTERLLLMDRLRYTPYVVPYGHKETNVTIRSSKNYIIVQGNDSTVNPLNLPDELHRDSLVWYNYRAALDFPLSNPLGVVADIATQLNAAKTQGACPEGFNLPLKKEVMGFFFENFQADYTNSLSSPIGIAVPSLRDVLWRQAGSLTLKTFETYDLENGRIYPAAPSSDTWACRFYVQENKSLRSINLFHKEDKHYQQGPYNLSSTSLGGKLPTETFCVRSTLNY